MEHKLPLGLLKQSIMKLDSFMSDVNEIREDGNIDDEIEETLMKMVELAGMMEATMINIVRKECDEEEFLSETIEMDGFDSYPDELDDILEKYV